MDSDAAPADEAVFETPAFAAPCSQWSAVVRVKLSAGEPAGWEPLQFLFRAPGRDATVYKPSELQQAAPALTEQLCFYSEIWFQSAFLAQRPFGG